MQTSARNRLTDTVVCCQEGAVNAEGVRTSALIQGSHIILAVAS